MENNKPSIYIVKLIMVGHRKNYVIPFSKGVNIIYGDSATGKSSILESINYLFGSSKLVYDTEIEASVRFIMMEVFLNGKPHVIKRDIFKPTNLIEVYLTSLDFIATVFPKKLTPNFDVDASPDGYFSDFMMNALNIPTVKIRQAPSKADSMMVRLSFRDVFKFCYLNQDDVGSKGILGSGNYALEIKNKETFKYIFNLLDSNVSDVQAELAGLSKDRNKTKDKYDSISDFLRETEFESEIGLSEVDAVLAHQEKAVKAQLLSVNNAMIADNENYLFLKEMLSELTRSISVLQNEKADSELAIDRYVRLKNDYQNDTQKLKSIRIAKSVIGAPEESFSCPLCESTVILARIKEQFSIDEGDRAAQEVNTLTRRMRDLDVLIQTERSKQHDFSNQFIIFNEDRDKARRLLDEESANMITPYLSERDGLSAELAKIEEKRKHLLHSLKVRNQQKIIFKEIFNLDERIQSMQEKLASLKLAAPSIEGVLSTLGDFLSSYLHHVKIKNQHDVSISKRTFLPILRGRDYRDITSGGLRTILSIGYFLSILEASNSSSTYIPSFLMIDTVGKYLGKTQTKYQETNVAEDRREELSDPAKYLNMYNYMFSIAKRAEVNNVTSQIILVDNDVPPQIQTQYADSIVAHFNSEGAEGLSRGLIDDAHLFTH